MEYFAAIDVSLEVSSVCVVDGAGKIVAERKAASEPEALVGLFRDLKLTFVRIGLEAGPLSQWLHDGLTAAGLPAGLSVDPGTGLIARVEVVEVLIGVCASLPA